MHWGRASLSGDDDAGGVNELTNAACDPDSRQPEFKHAAIRVTRAAFGFEAVWWRCVGDDPIALRERVRAASSGVGNAIVAFHDGTRPIVLLRLGARERPSDRE